MIEMIYRPNRSLTFENLGKFYLKLELTFHSNWFCVKQFFKKIFEGQFLFYLEDDKIEL